MQNTSNTEAKLQEIAKSWPQPDQAMMAAFEKIHSGFRWSRTFELAWFKAGWEAANAQ